MGTVIKWEQSYWGVFIGLVILPRFEVFVKTETGTVILLRVVVLSDWDWDCHPNGEWADSPNLGLRLPS